MQLKNYDESKIFNSIKELIVKTKSKIYIEINSNITKLYWQIGRILHNEVLKCKKAIYGDKLISNLSKQLTLEYGKGWSERQLRYCIKIAEVFNDKEILHAVCAKLSWSHLRNITARRRTIY